MTPTNPEYFMYITIVMAVSRKVVNNQGRKLVELEELKKDR